VLLPEPPLLAEAPAVPEPLLPEPRPLPELAPAEPPALPELALAVPLLPAGAPPPAAPELLLPEPFPLSVPPLIAASASRDGEGAAFELQCVSDRRETKHTEASSQ
jgi:hypothetical protein